MDSAEVRNLLRPEAFPHAVGELRLIETHISWVVLTGDYAYKIKKPVEMGFLDFSTLEYREHYCREELRLNRRLAPELYLDVVAITRRDGQTAVAARDEDDGDAEVIDYAVCMRQFDQRRLASRAADEGRLTPARCRELGRTVALFHNGLEPVRPQAPDGAGTPAAILAAARQNFRQIDEALPPEADRKALRQLEEASLAESEQLEPLMRRRVEDGYVRECHGDLHLDNIVLMDDRVLPFDCIEFNPDFRLIDIQCEIGFVVMDLDSRELPGLANRALNTWLEYTGDYAGLALHAFYDVYLAMVRAKISLYSALAAVADSDEAPDLSACRRYLSLAAAGRRRLPRFLCLMMGVSGSGKSTVAEDLSARYSAIRLRSDVERKRLFGLAPDGDSAAAGLDEELYRAETSDRVFARLAELADGVLDAGLPVVVDATFIEERRRRPFRELAERLGVPLLIVHCTADEAELERRLTARRQESREASEAGVAIMRSQLAAVEPPTPEEVEHLLLVDTQAPEHEQRLASAVERRITSRRDS